jgi:hypothetical protein
VASKLGIVDQTSPFLTSSGLIVSTIVSSGAYLERNAGFVASFLSVGASAWTANIASSSPGASVLMPLPSLPLFVLEHAGEGATAVSDRPRQRRETHCLRTDHETVECHSRELLADSPPRDCRERLERIVVALLVGAIRKFDAGKRALVDERPKDVDAFEVLRSLGRAHAAPFGIVLPRAARKNPAGITVAPHGHDASRSTGSPCWTRRSTFPPQCEHTPTTRMTVSVRIGATHLLDGGADHGLDRVGSLDGVAALNGHYDRPSSASTTRPT